MPNDIMTGSRDTTGSRRDSEALTNANGISADETIEYESMQGILGIEDVQSYNKGGNHPVHLDDVLEGRFEVVHKLGHGGFGIVWLCRDILLGKWRAVKVMAAEHSSRGNEERIYSYLRNRCTLKELEENHLTIPSEQFWIEGPNGRHLCLVMPVLGWTVSDWRMSKRDFLEQTDIEAKEACRQIAKALHFLHSHGIGHGDFRPENILMQIEGVDDLDKDQILDLLGEPECVDVTIESGRSSVPRAPEYCVQRADEYWCRNMSTASITIVDFGESFFAATPPRTTGIPNQYAPPEIMFNETGVPGLYSDIWSLACTLFEVRTSSVLFEPPLGGVSNMPVDSIEVYLGPLPKLYSMAYVEMFRDIQRAIRTPAPAGEETKPEPRKPLTSPERKAPRETKAERIERSRHRLTDGSGYSDVFEARLGEEQKVLRELQGPEYASLYPNSEFITWQYTRKEVLELADLLRKMLRYDPAERIDIDEVISHPWIGAEIRYASIRKLLGYRVFMRDFGIILPTLVVAFMAIPVLWISAPRVVGLFLEESSSKLSQLVTKGWRVLLQNIL
ncbi:kinase-like protein [Hypoxylon rubiginosum]|uniref:Kinase-like protein n=1 Tax=Hypoxylon rubiginosum TaxID=110542 RepID=A0ACB9YYI0_9PEZI|nr:kinase-like protein [Hypoxylon rubiginosum]